MPSSSEHHDTLCIKEDEGIMLDLLSQFAATENSTNSDDGSVGCCISPLTSLHGSYTNLLSELEQLDANKAAQTMLREWEPATENRDSTSPLAGHEDQKKYHCLERAQVYFEAGQFQESLEEGYQSTKLGADFKEGYHWIGMTLVKLGCFAEAQWPLVQTTGQVEYRIGELLSLWTKAQNMLNLGRPSDCVDALLPLVPHATHSSEVMHLFTIACQASRQWAPLYETLESALCHPPFQEDAYWPYMCAMAAYNSAMVPECLLVLDTHPNVQATYPEAGSWLKKCHWVTELGRQTQSCLASRRFTMANKQLAQAIGRCSEVPAMQQLLRSWQAQVLAAQKASPDVVITACTTALEGNSYHWSVLPLMIRAESYTKKEELALAAEDYGRVLEIQPHNWLARQELPRLQDSIPNLYGILHVHPNAPEAELASAYRQLALQLHPDIHINEASQEEKRRLRIKFHELREAFELLSDTSKRAEYDEFLLLGK